MAERILIGIVVGAHGVRGEIRVKSFTADPSAIAAYGPLSDEAGRRQIVLGVTGRMKGGVIARVEGVADRDGAAALRGLRLFLPRAALPKTGDDEFYPADLIGLRAERVDGRAYGRVTNLCDFGAGELLEIALAAGGQEFLPFTERVVPVVDLAAGRIVVDPPHPVEALAPGADRTAGEASGARHD